VQLTSKDGRDFVKRDVVLVDDTATSMEVSLWGEMAKVENGKFEGHPVLACKGVSVKEWNGGRSGSVLSSGTVVFHPEIAEAKRIKQWWSDGGSTQTVAALSIQGGAGAGRARNAKKVTLAELRSAADQLVERAEIYTVVARLGFLQMRKQGDQQPLQYLACMETKPGSTLLCNRRVDETGFCAACQKAGKVQARLNVRCRFSDFEDSAWLTTFHEAAQEVLAMKADEVREMELHGDREKLESIIRGKYFGAPLQLTVRAKLDTWNGETRTGITCIDARPVSLGEHGRKMLSDVLSMLES